MPVPGTVISFAATRPQVCCPISDYVGCYTGLLKTFYSDSEATAQCELFLTALTRNVLTYLQLFWLNITQILYLRLMVPKSHTTSNNIIDSGNGHHRQACPIDDFQPHSRSQWTSLEAGLRFDVDTRLQRVSTDQFAQQKLFPVRNSVLQHWTHTMTTAMYYINETAIHSRLLFYMLIMN